MKIFYILNLIVILSITSIKADVLEQPTQTLSPLDISDTSDISIFKDTKRTSSNKKSKVTNPKLMRKMRDTPRIFDRTTE